VIFSSSLDYCTVAAIVVRDGCQNYSKAHHIDGEARSGKGTIVHAVKDYLRDYQGYKVMLIDAGQVFRVLVVAASEAGVDLDSPLAIDAFLSDEKQVEKCVQFVKEVYRMPEERREDLLYAHHIGMASAKVGARPLSQSFKDRLLKKWLQDAHKEGFDIVLLDGRALEETGMMLENDGLCRFILGFYFTSNPVVGARRTLGLRPRRTSNSGHLRNTKLMSW
jgi:cytidylate kinase